MANPDTTQLGAPSASKHQMGRFTINKIYQCEASAAAPVSATRLDSIVSVDIGAPTFDYEADVRQQAGGDDKTHIQRGARYDGTITVLSGDFGSLLASLRATTWDATAVALPLANDSDSPTIIWEAICRDADNTTHLFSLVIQDMILDDVGLTNALEYADRTISFHTYHKPFLLYEGHKLVYDVWDATPATPAYALSCGTPAPMLTAGNYDGWHFNNAAFIKQLDNSAGDTIGKRRTSGVSISGGTLTFSTGTPAASDKIYALYAKAS